MNRRRVVGLGLAAALLLGLLVWAFAPRPLAVEVEAASLGPFESAIEEEARTRLRDRYVVSAPLAGRLQRPQLREGDAVARGAEVARIDPLLSPLLDARSLQELQARRGGAEAAVQAAGAQAAAAMLARERAEVEWRRTQQLSEQGFVAATRLDSDRLAAQAAQKAEEAAREALHRARHELEQAQAALQAVRGAPSAGGLALRSPIAGRVLKVHQPSESSVAAGTPLLDVGDLAGLEVVAELLSTDAGLARPGSAVRIERWGGPGVLQGEVRRVEPAAFTKVSALGVEEQRVRVLIDLRSPAAEWASLGDGYRVSVRIVTQRQEAVLRAPVSALFPLPPADDSASASTSSADERAGVFVVEQGRARLRTVVLGGRSGRWAWVKSGLGPNDRLVVYPPPALSDGARVAARPG